MKISELEEELFWQIQATGLPLPVREYRFAPGRRFRLDFCWPDIPGKPYLEIEGGIWLAKSGHNSGRGISRDIEKGNLAALLGFTGYRATTNMIRDGSALTLVEQFLAQTQKKKGA